MKLPFALVAVVIATTSCISDAPTDADTPVSLPVPEWHEVPAEHNEALLQVVTTMTAVVEAQRAHFGRHGRFGTVGALMAGRLPVGVALYEHSLAPDAYIVAGSHYQTPGSACVVHVGARPADGTAADGEQAEIRAFGMPLPSDEERIQCAGGVVDLVLARLWTARFQGSIQRVQPRH